MKNFTLRNLLIRNFLIVSFIVTLVASLGYMINDFLILRSSVIEHQNTLAEVIGRNLAASLTFHDKDESTRVLKTLSSYPKIIAAELYDTKDQLITRYDVASDAETTPASETTTSFDIRENGEFLGKLVIRSRFEHFKDFADKYLFIFFIATILSVALSYLFSRYIQAQVVTPMESLTAKLKKLAYSEGKAHALELNSSNLSELNELSNAFNLMASNLLERDQAIKHYTDNLEALVETKTRELMEEKGKQVQNAKMISLGEMASGIAHEINNPLAVIDGTVTILKDLHSQKTLDDEKLSKFLERIEKTTHRITGIIKGLRSFSRDGSKDEFKDASLKTIVEETMIFCGTRFRNNDVSLIISDIPDDYIIHCQSVQISQVILNLFNNAFDATEKLPERWVKFDVSANDDVIDFTVTDSGSGIPAELREKIMQPFFTTKDVGKGTGLGLSISKGIIEKHQGTFSINPQSPNTQFCVTLPRVR